jgi:preprotein translocase subunit SecD
MKTRRLGLQLLFIVLLAFGSVAATLVADNEPQLGLDLQGGFSVVLEARGNPPEQSVEEAKDIIARRVDSLGVGEPDITRQGKTVIVQLPGVKDRKKAQEVVGQTAKLEFRPVIADLQINKDAGPNEDPCKADESTTTSTTAPVDPNASTTVPADPNANTTVPADPNATTVPGETTTTAPGGTTTTVAPEGAEGGDETGAPAPRFSEGESAAPLQETTTTTTAPVDPNATTAPVDPNATTVPVDPNAATTVPPTGEPGETEAPADQVAYPHQDRTRCLLLGPVGFQGTALSRAKAEIDQSGQWLVSVRVKGGNKDEANALFNDCATGTSQTCPGGQGGPGRAAIVLDKEVISDPAVQSQNLADDDFQITGNFTQSDAKQLEVVLRYGALPVEFVQKAEQQVSATLGRDSLKAGLIAGAVGIAAVALYMLVYYRALGLVVIAGLSIWAALMYSIICLLSVSQGLALTLAGITGIIVSVGTTVDSYVVYFERLRDELRAGRTIRNATTRGFQEAFRTILTADVSSFIGAFLLWWLTVGPVRGFAFFLGLATVLDVVVAYFFTRPAVILLGRNRLFTEARFFGIARGMRPADAATTGGVK